MLRKILLIAVTIGALSGCDYLPFGFTEIKEVVQHPSTFEGKEIKVKGKVADVTKIPFVDIRMYSLRDNGGEIIVLTDGPLPGTNQDIKIRATVDSTAIIGGQSIGLKLRELKRL